MPYACQCVCAFDGDQRARCAPPPGDHVHCPSHPCFSIRRPPKRTSGTAGGVPYIAGAAWALHLRCPT